MTKNCEYPKCNLPSDIVYLDKPLCDKHWVKITEMDMKDGWKKLGIPPLEKK